MPLSDHTGSLLPLALPLSLEEMSKYRYTETGSINVSQNHVLAYLVLCLNNLENLGQTKVNLSVYKPIASFHEMACLLSFDLVRQQST